MATTPQSALKGVWLTSMGMGKTRTGNVRYMKSLTSALSEHCDLDLIYYTSRDNIDQHTKALSSTFGKVYGIPSPPSYHARPRGGDNGLCSINDWISRSLLDWCSENVTADKYDFIICDYIYMSPVFDGIDDKVVKIINTHDRIGDRHLELNWTDKDIRKHFCVSIEEEKRACSKADILLVITEQERDYFHSLHQDSQKCVLIQYLPDIAKKSPRRHYLSNSICNIGFLGSSNPVNTAGLTDFLDVFFASNSSNYKIRVAGKVCENITYNDSRLELLGEVNDESSFYDTIDMLINPMPKGSSGLKIKTIDSLSNAVPVLGTRDAFWGLDSSSLWHNFETISDLCSALVNTQPTNEFLLSLRSDSLACFERYTSKIQHQIANVIQKISSVKTLKAEPRSTRDLILEHDYKHSKIICNIHDNYIEKLAFYRNQSKTNWDKYVSATQKLKDASRSATTKSSELIPTLINEQLAKESNNSPYSLVSSLLQNSPTKNNMATSSIYLEHGQGIGDALLFSPLIKLKYCLNYKHIFLRTPKLRRVFDRIYSDCPNISIIDSVPSEKKLHTINFMEAVYHFSWRYPAYIRDLPAETKAYQRFTSVFGKQYILIHQRLRDNMGRPMKAINNALINNPARLPVVNLDFEAMRQHGLDDIDYLDHRMIIERATSIHFYEGSFSHLADICDLSTLQEAPSLHLYCKPHLWDKSLPHHRILYFLQSKNWFRYNWTVFYDEAGAITCETK